MKILETIPNGEGEIRFVLYPLFVSGGDISLTLRLPATPKQVEAFLNAFHALKEAGEYEPPIMGGEAGEHRWTDWGLDDPNAGEWER